MRTEEWRAGGARAGVGLGTASAVLAHLAGALAEGVLLAVYVAAATMARVVELRDRMGCEPAGSGFADLLKQGGGAFVALIGIVVTVAGLIGLKLYGSTGSLRQCTKGWKWTSSLAAWCVGQLLQLCAVELASEPVITAVSTLAVPANALLAWKILGEPVTRKERLAIVAMTVGAGMVVVSSPQQARSAMTVRQEEALLTASVLPAIGLLVTLLVTQAR